MELSERYIKKLEAEGYEHVYDWHDVPGTIHEEHEHADRSSIIVTDGYMDVTVGDVSKRLDVHDRIDIPAYTKHSAKIGSTGCGYVMGEMKVDKV